MGADQVGVGDPALGRAGDDDFTRLPIFGGIDEHILHARQAGEPDNIVGDVTPLGGSAGHLGLKSRQRHLAKRRTLANVAGQLGVGGHTPLAGEPRIGDEARSEHPLGVDHDTSRARGAAQSTTTTTLATTTLATATLAAATHAATTLSATPLATAALTTTHATAATTHATLGMGESGGRDCHGESHDRRRQQRGEAVDEGHPVSEGLGHGRTRRRRNGLPTFDSRRAPQTGACPQGTPRRS